MRGPGYRGDGDGGSDEDVSTVRGGGEGGGIGSDEASEAPLHVDSYAVNVGPTDEEIRQRILANTAHAEAVTALGGGPKTRRNSSTVLLRVAVVDRKDSAVPSPLKGSFA